MTHTPDDHSTTTDGADLAEIRTEIDELQKVPTDELVSPTPADLQDVEPEPEPTDAIGSEDWEG